jgi:hypothetical protein
VKKAIFTLGRLISFLKWIIVILCVSFLLRTGFSFWNKFSCEHVILLAAPGPKKIDAFVITNFCMTETTQIELRDNFIDEKEVVLEYEPGNNIVTLNWVDADHLNVTLAWVKNIKLQTTQWQNVHITYQIEKTGH